MTDQLAQDLVVCGAFAHPAFLTENHFRQVKSMSIAASVREQSKLMASVNRTSFPELLRDRPYLPH